MIVEYLTVNKVENCSVLTHQIVKIVKNDQQFLKVQTSHPPLTHCGLGTRLIPLTTRPASG